jgi:FkbM family methyltransferase
VTVEKMFSRKIDLHPRAIRADDSLQIGKTSKSMKALQNAAYVGKRLGAGIFGRAVNHAAKYAAGCYFDLRRNPYRTEGMTFEIPREHTTRVMRGRFAADTYELPERELIRKHLPPEARVLELGGCIGVVSCLINRLLSEPDAHVVVEANPLLIPFLERNRDINRARFSVEQCVVSRSSEAILKINANMDSSKTGDGGLKVPTRTLEHIEGMYHLKFDALVMDIEGSESEFIRDNRATLQRMHFIMVEFHPSLIGEAEVGVLRQILIESGLDKVDQRLTSEVFQRRNA